MSGVGDGSMSSRPKILSMPLMENEDGSVGVDMSSLSDSENHGTAIASLESALKFCRFLNEDKHKNLQVKILKEPNEVRREELQEKLNLLDRYFMRVKVPTKHLSSIPGFFPTLLQMGFNTIEDADSTYVVLREDISLQIASGVKLMPQRENIASSSKPWNLHQTPNAISAVQTPSETVCEQRLEFQQPSQAFPVGRTGVENDNVEAVGPQGLSAGSEFPECEVQTNKRPHPENESELPPTRPRGPDFQDKEKELVLQFKLEYYLDPRKQGKPRLWDFITDKMEANGYSRNWKSWQGLWDTLRKNLKALCKWSLHDRVKLSTYSDLTMDQKKAIKKTDLDFPLTFEHKWYITMENIKKMKPPSRTAKKKTRRDGQEGVFSQPSASTIFTGSANFAGAGSSYASFQAPLQTPGQVTAQGSYEDLHIVNQQGHGAVIHQIQDFVSSSQSLRKKYYEDITVTMEEQLTVQRELTAVTPSASEMPVEEGLELQRELAASAVWTPMDGSKPDLSMDGSISFSTVFDY